MKYNTSMKIIYLIIISVLCFLSIFLGGKKFRSTALYALAIGGVVNSNFFHPLDYPIMCFGLPFGIDSIIYTLFVFCVIVMFFKSGKGSAYTLLISSIVAIMFSAIMQLFSDLLSTGSSTECWQSFLNFSISAVASLIALSIMLEIMQKLKNKNLNEYLILLIAILIATVADSILYLGAFSLINGIIENFGKLLLASIIGKTIAILCSIGCYYLINLFDSKPTKSKSNEQIEQ